MTLPRVRDIAAMPPDTPREEFVDLIDDDYRTMRLCVMAEATRRNTPAALGQLLREPDWHEDWCDALVSAEGNHQIAVMRAAFTHGVRSREHTVAKATLSLIRRRMEEVRDLLRSGRDNPDPIVTEPGHAPTRRATRDLVRAHLAEFETILTDRLTLHGHSPYLAHKKHGEDLGPWAAKAHYPGMPPVTSNVATLIEASYGEFERIVIDDTRDRRHEPDLEHPLVLGRWGDVLRRTGRSILTGLDLPFNADMVVADRSLRTNGLTHQEAYQRINALRYLVHIRQRWMEYRALNRAFQTELTHWYRDVIEPHRHATWEVLRERHPHEYANLLADARRDLPAEEPGA